MLEVSTKPVQKIGSKIFVVRQVVEKSHTMLVELPEKEKSLFELPEAVSVLYPDISEAFQKNYTQEEITDILRSAGWVLKDRNLKYLWKLFRAEGKNLHGKKNTPTELEGKDPPSHFPDIAQDVINIPSNLSEMILGLAKASDETMENVSSEHVQENVTDEEKSVSLFQKSEKESGNKRRKTSSEKSDVMSEEKPQPQSGAHFELPPDTEDI